MGPYTENERVGLVPIAARPYHVGHDLLIRRASRECDRVIVFASLSDRKRKGETPILGSDMATIWNAVIEPTLPENVVVSYGGSPVGNVWKLLGEASETGLETEFFIYGDEDDVTENFPDSSIVKYAPDANVSRAPVSRSTTAVVSGTDIRLMIAIGDREGFSLKMPSSFVREDIDMIWSMFRRSAKL